MELPNTKFVCHGFCRKASCFKSNEQQTPAPGYAQLFTSNFLHQDSKVALFIKLQK